MNKSSKSKNKIEEILQGITSISVSGYKSLYEECSVAVHPLTILAGANSSGKSSIMQPLLLLKQTLEATYDPGALLLDGPNVRFTSTKQIFSLISEQKNTDILRITVEINSRRNIVTLFKKQPRKGVRLIEMDYNTPSEKIHLFEEMSHEDILSALPEKVSDFYQGFLHGIKRREKHLEDKIKLQIGRNRCFFDIQINMDSEKYQNQFLTSVSASISAIQSDLFEKQIRKLIHVPGLRGNPERTYKTTAVSNEFSGTFENYVASIISQWQETKDQRLRELGDALETLGLTWKVDARQIDDTQVELRVGRLPHSTMSTKQDMVSIADVGFGVSQTLPVLVALLVAEPGQLVYLEQPEIHLHPRAQASLAKILVDAANRGVRVVVETHSDLLLTRLQALVAEGQISTDKVKLHWFQRREDGVTEVKTAELDETGAFGDWPVDFGGVALEEEGRYLNAAESRLLNS